MCVIMAAVTERPTRQEMQLAWDTNPHGAGVAWLEGGTVRFEKVGPGKKGVERVVELATRVPLPFVVHFRITSSGTTTARLSHPFPLRRDDPLALTGDCREGVLFHNGTWKGWQPHLLAAACSTGAPLGDGPLSDTRAMAYLATELGLGVLETVPGGNRMAVLTPKGVRRWGDGWTEYAKGLWVSNTWWVPVKPAAAKPAATKPPVISGPTRAADDRVLTMSKGVPKLVAKDEALAARLAKKWVG